MVREEVTVRTAGGRRRRFMLERSRRPLLSQSSSPHRYLMMAFPPASTTSCGTLPRSVAGTVSCSRKMSLPSDRGSCETWLPSSRRLTSRVSSMHTGGSVVIRLCCRSSVLRVSMQPLRFPGTTWISLLGRRRVSRSVSVSPSTSGMLASLLCPRLSSVNCDSIETSATTPVTMLCSRDSALSPRSVMHSSMGTPRKELCDRSTEVSMPSVGTKVGSWSSWHLRISSSSMPSICSGAAVNWKAASA
mmetsp:Transcript_41760/g.101924  ORF Transcript_41760/g.101924 Transcript_41760/m.101924 type:complete len:246 (+) Transcript_41760:195-932(+)